MREFSLKDFAAFCADGAALEHSIKTARRTALMIAAAAIATEAKRVLGTYDYGWPQLADATQADREKHGYPANEPLLRDGTLRDSIQWTLVSDREAQIGSDLDIAVYQELGTGKIPARSFLAGAAAHLEHDVVKALGKVVALTIVRHVHGRA